MVRAAQREPQSLAEPEAQEVLPEAGWGRWRSLAVRVLGPVALW